MAIKQMLWSLDDKEELPLSALISEKELEDLLENNISLLNDNWFVVGRQVDIKPHGEIDLLCIDTAGNPVIIELKRDMTPREVTAQALDYAAWVKSKIETDELEQELAEIYLTYTKEQKSLNEAYQERFGMVLEGNNDDIDVKIVIVAAEMDGRTERILAFLQKYNLDINVLFFNVFEHQGKRLLGRAWMFEPETVAKPKASTSRNWNGEYYFSYGTGEARSWKDAVEFGFVSAGGGKWYTNTLKSLETGDRIWVNIPQEGYVGVGTVTEEARPAHETKFPFQGGEKDFFELPLTGGYLKDFPADKAEYIVKVNWVKTVPQNQAISEYGFFGNQNTVCRPKVEKWDFTVNRLKEIWNLKEL